MGLGQRWQATENPFARTRKWVKGDGEWPSIMIDRLQATTRNPQGAWCGRPHPLAQESLLVLKGCFWFLTFAGRKPKEANIQSFLVQSYTTAAFSCSLDTHSADRLVLLATVG